MTKIDAQEAIRLAEEKARLLALSELRYRRLFETAQDGVLLIDFETGMIMDVNPFLIKMLGYSKEDFLEKHLWEVGVFKDVAASKDNFKTLQDKRYVRFEDLPLETKSGKKMQVEFVANAYTVGDGTIIQCNVRDITQRKKVETALKESENKFKAIINAAPDAFLIVRYADSKIVSANSSFEQLSGYKQAEVVGKTTKELNLWQDDKERERFIKSLESSSVLTDFETVLRGKSGKPVTCLLAASIFTLGHEIYIVSSARNIDRRKQNEQKIKDAETLLRACVESPKEMIILAIDKEYRYLFFNNFHDAVMKSFYGSHPALGASLLDCVAIKADNDKAKAAYDRALAGESFVAVDVYGRESDHYFETNYNPIYNDRQEIVGATAFASEVTGRVRMERALRESEDKYKTLFNSTGDAIVVHYYDEQGVPGNFINVNEAMCRRYGYTREELLQMSPADIDEPVSFKQNALPGIRALAKNGSATFETVHLTKGGERVLVEVNAAQIMLDGRPAMLAIARDITGRVESEAALKESEIKFRSLFNNAEVGMFRTRLDGSELLDLNDKYLSILEMKREEIIGKPSVSVWAEPQERARMVKVLKKQGYVEDFEFKLLTKSGKIKICLTSLRLYPETGVLEGSLQDITERRWAENERNAAMAKLKKSEKELMEAETIAGLGRYSYDIITDQWESSAILDNIFGIDKDYARDENGWANLIHPDQREMMDQYFRQEVLGRKKSFDKEYKIVRPANMEERWVHGKGKLELDGKGAVVRMIGTIMDITEKKLAETAKSEFLYLASHQLRTPLSSTKWLLDIFRHDEGLSSKHLERITDLYSCNQKLIALVDSLLKVSHIEEGKITIKKEEADLTKLVAGSVHSLEPNAKNRTQKLQLKMSKTVRPVFIDAIRFDEALSNLVGNAIVYSPEGQVITITVENKDKEYLLSIHNDLPLISKADQQKLFTRFYRGTGSDRFNTGGSGLGLFIAKEAVKSNGGEIWLESKKGAGTTFYFTVPKR